VRRTGEGHRTLSNNDSLGDDVVPTLRAAAKEYLLCEVPYSPTLFQVDNWYNVASLTGKQLSARGIWEWSWSLQCPVTVGGEEVNVDWVQRYQGNRDRSRTGS
jgi:hypothetical protein